MGQRLQGQRQGPCTGHCLGIGRHVCKLVLQLLSRLMVYLLDLLVCWFVSRLLRFQRHLVNWSFGQFTGTGLGCCRRGPTEYLSNVFLRFGCSFPLGESHDGPHSWRWVLTNTHLMTIPSCLPLPLLPTPTLCSASFPLCAVAPTATFGGQV